MKVLRILIIFFSIGVLLIGTEGECRKLGSLYSMLSGLDEVKVYISEMTNSSGNKEVDTAALRTLLSKALDSRKSINFKTVGEKKNADIVIDTVIKEFIWTEDDPIDMITGAAAVAIDALKQENYGRVQAEFTVSNAKTGKVIWSDVEKATITDEKMSESESIGRLNERLVYVFIREAFSKGNSATR